MYYENIFKNSDTTKPKNTMLTDAFVSGKILRRSKRMIITKFSSVWGGRQRRHLIRRRIWSINGIGKNVLLRLGGVSRYVCFILMLPNFHFYFISTLTISSMCQSLPDFSFSDISLTDFLYSGFLIPIIQCWSSRAVEMKTCWPLGVLLFVS